ncbi:collagen alpha-1(I) chain-like [Vulpes lagopus]|uniref:collagen alpha-1(I) chain-like n=1 Tax=Vulpes lagopus TaxID=494514 RepID=UPI001BC9A6AF|nr:collagen alpha-1(I) chain-like [Vulpes lagopus]
MGRGALLGTARTAGDFRLAVTGRLLLTACWPGPLTRGSPRPWKCDPITRSHRGRLATPGGERTRPPCCEQTPRKDSPSSPRHQSSPTALTLQGIFTEISGNTHCSLSAPSTGGPEPGGCCALLAPQPHCGEATRRGRGFGAGLANAVPWPSSHGPPNPAGAPGEPSSDGPPNLAGAPGEPSSDGPPNLAGAPGEPSSDGPPNPAGAPGEPSSHGPPNPAGAPGEPSSDGPPNPAGAPGSLGEQMSKRTTSCSTSLLQDYRILACQGTATAPRTTGLRLRRLPTSLDSLRPLLLEEMSVVLRACILPARGQGPARGYSTGAGKEAALLASLPHRDSTSRGPVTWEPQRSSQEEDAGRWGAVPSDGAPGAASMQPLRALLKRPAALG